jgi:hypothetical protein
LFFYPLQAFLSNFQYFPSKMQLPFLTKNWEEKSHLKKHL